MTNEEAREILKRVEIAKPIKFEDYADMREALDIATKALEQQSYNNCVSREEVNRLVDELARAISDERGCISRGRSTATILQDILNLPPVTPQQTELEKKYMDGYNDGYDDGYEDAEEIFS